MDFYVDPRITSSCFELFDWPLCRVFLKNNANYPWLILVPRHPHIQGIDQLPPNLQHLLIDEISRLSAIVRELFQPDALNVGALGNIVSQLHIHIIARFTQDALWPHGVWQKEQINTPYSQLALDALFKQLHQVNASWPSLIADEHFCI